MHTYTRPQIQIKKTSLAPLTGPCGSSMEARGAPANQSDAARKRRERQLRRDRRGAHRTDAEGHAAEAQKQKTCSKQVEPCVSCTKATLFS